MKPEPKKQSSSGTAQASKFEIRQRLSAARPKAFFWAKYPNDLYLEIANAGKFEKDPGKYEIALQYLLLHELIHYVRHHASLADETLADGSDLGDAFEKDAYGRDMSNVWNSGAAKFDRGIIKL